MTTALSRLLNQHREGRSIRALALKATEAGHSISPSSIGTYLNGTHPHAPSQEQLEAVAAAFDLRPEDVVSAAAILPAEEPWTPPAESVYLLPADRRFVDDFVRLLARKNRRAGIFISYAEQDADRAQAIRTAIEQIDKQGERDPS